MICIKKINVFIVVSILALLLSIANLYAVYNIMEEVDNMYTNMMYIKESVEQKIQEVMDNLNVWEKMKSDFIIIPTSEMVIQARPEMLGDVVRFYYKNDMAILNVYLPLNTTYRFDIYAYSRLGQTKMGSALELIIDGESWGIITFNNKEWNWAYLDMIQMNAGKHEIKIINQEGQELGDRDTEFTKIRIMWLEK